MDEEKDVLIEAIPIESSKTYMQVVLLAIIEGMAAFLFSKPAK